jgi:hypothetical protein
MKSELTKRLELHLYGVACRKARMGMRLFDAFFFHLHKSSGGK